MTHRIFFPQPLLDILLSDGTVDLDGEDLVLSGEAPYRYRVQEAVRVTREVTTGEDPRDICGRVKLRSQLAEELDAEILGNSMLVDDSAYDIVPGFLGEPVGDVPADHGKPEKDVLAALSNIEE